MRAYYNEIDRFCCDWLSNLMDAGHITPGVIDDTDIREVDPDSARGFDRAHFFAGIAGWELALKWAGWGERPVWTGSCPCQPFSSAGQRKGDADERHLWPAFQSLIAQCQPSVVFGEQVAGAFGREWVAAVRADLEECGYAVGAADLCAAGIGAPHIRQRLYWMANANDANGRSRARRGNTQGEHLLHREWTEDAVSLGSCGSDGGLGNADRQRYEIGIRDARDDGAEAEQEGRQAVEQAGPWNNCVLIPCADGKARPTPDPESGILPLAHGIPGRVGRLRAYGNAIVPQLAATFIQSFMDTKQGEIIP